MTIDPEYYLVLVLWPITLGLLLANAWRGRRPVVGLALAYWFNLWLNHWLGAFIQILPWHTSADRVDTIAGFKVTGYAMAGLLVGNLALGALFLPRRRREGAGPAVRKRPDPKMYIWMGLLCTFGISIVVGRIPGMAAVTSAGLSLAVVGFCLWWWQLRQSGAGLQSWSVLAFSLILPACTVLIQGMMGYGVLACLAIACFVAAHHRPRWAVIAGGAACLFLGLSLYPAYMQARKEIRRVVWGGQAYEERIATVGASLQERWKWFDSKDESHLGAIEARLNQNSLVGKAVHNIDAGRVPLAHGETLWTSALALIPRAVWPAKPAWAGSRGLVTRFTGMTFAEGTSVGIGHVMELFVNFGRSGIFAGFVLLGLLLAIADYVAGKSLMAGDWKWVALWFAIGQSMLQVGGNFAEMTASAAGAAILCLAVNRLLPSRVLAPQR